jgi:hypothetical protein
MNIFVIITNFPLQMGLIDGYGMNQVCYNIYLYTLIIYELCWVGYM